jgi:energy-coupling factor transporter ATP-binding protein EcfA2
MSMQPQHVTPLPSFLKPVSLPKTVPIKIGWFGPQGSGKTTSAALLALALSKEVYGGAPVFVTDTEPGWQFLRPIFATEGVELIQRTDPTFRAMTDNLRDAEKLGACVWNVDTLTIIWNELMQSFKQKNRGFIPIDKWGDIREMWNKDYVALFLNTSMCCQALGRLGNITEELQDDQNPDKIKLIKTGTRFKAGGSEDFGYEPHLLLEISTERKAKTVAGSKREGEGRMIHRVDVLKDRTWALNGKVIRWSDKPRYEKGGYRQVWEAIKPHWDAVQATAHVRIETGTNSQELISVDGTSAHYQRARRVQITLEEIEGTLVALWAGQDAKSKELKKLAVETLFATRSWTAVESKGLDELELGLKSLRIFEEQAKEHGDALLDKTAMVRLLETSRKEAQEEPDPEWISAREARLLVATAVRMGWKETEFISALVKQKGIAGPTHIPVSLYEEIVQMIQAGNDPDAPKEKTIVLEGVQCH